MSMGIRDKVAVIGIGCTKFGERFDCSLEDLMVEAVSECLEDARIELDDIDAFWFGTYSSGLAGDTLSNRLEQFQKFWFQLFSFLTVDFCWVSFDNLYIIDKEVRHCS